MVGAERYGGPESFRKFEAQRRNRALRDGLLSEIVSLFPRDIAIIQRGGKCRPRLRVKRGPTISVVVARPVRMAGGTSAGFWTRLLTNADL